MVIDKILTVLDAVTAFVLATHVALGWFSAEIVVYHAAYIILKGLIFFLSDWASKIDVLAGVYMLLVAFDVFSLTIINQAKKALNSFRCYFLALNFLGWDLLALKKDNKKITNIKTRINEIIALINTKKINKNKETKAVIKILFNKEVFLSNFRKRTTPMIKTNKKIRFEIKLIRIFK